MRIACFAFLLFLLCCPAGLSEAQRCSDQRPPFVGYSFVNPNLISPRIPGARLFVDMEELEAYYREQGDPQVKGNLEEWHERYCGLPDIRDIGALIYQTSTADIEQLRTAIRSPSVPLSYALADNSFARYLKRNKCLETADYLLYAKACEPYVTRRDPWEQPQLMYQDMSDLIEQGLTAFDGVASHYIRLRYAYQIIRLAHYSKQYERVLELCQNLLPKVDNDPSIVEDWILGHRAGAMMALGQRVEASYLFSRLFATCPSKRESAYLSFSVRTDAEWDACLALCKSPAEEATLFAIRGSFSDSKRLVEMKHIYERDPSSPYLTLFLVQELRKLERELLGLSFNPNRQQNKFYYGVPAADAGQQAIRLQQFVTQVLQEGVLQKVELWRIAQGYLAMLAGNFYDAQRSFEAARRMDLPDILKQQLDAFELALFVNTLVDIDEEDENEIYNLQRSDAAYQAFEDFSPFVRDRLIQLYESSGQLGKAFLMQYPLSHLKANMKPELLEDLLVLVRKPSPSKLEIQMIADGDSTILDELLNMKTSYFIAEYKFEAALATMKRMKRVNWSNYGFFNPFVERFRDCVHCPLPTNVPIYTKGELLEILLDKQYQARAGTGNLGVLYYEIGLALYNMSYFGQAWKAADFYRSGASLRTSYLRDGDNVTPHPVFPYGNRENFDCSRARLYFERARVTTDSTELAAKATFMAAKCERNEYYVNRWRPDAVQTFENFELLQQNYANTDFYQQVLKECLYFRAYATR